MLRVLLLLAGVVGSATIVVAGMLFAVHALCRRRP